MEIELIGCTGAGKSTLLKQVLGACRDKQISAWDSDSYLLSLVGLNFVRGHLLRTILVDLMALTACLFSQQRYAEYFHLVWVAVSMLPSSIPLWQRLNIFRNAMKKAGTREIIRRFVRPGQWIIQDEGTLTSANYLFVNLTTEPNHEVIRGFAQTVPLPDLAIYLYQPEDLLVERTLQRGHKRIPAGSREHAETFIRRAITTLELIVNHPRITSLVVRFDGNEPE